MDDAKRTKNEPLLLVPRRLGVNKFLRAGSKRQTKVRAFQITYDKAHRGTPARDTLIQDRCKVDQKGSTRRSSRVANKSQELGVSAGSGSFSKAENIPRSSQHDSTQDDHSEEQGILSPLNQSRKGLPNQSGQLSGTPSKSQHETRNQIEIPDMDSVDDRRSTVPHDKSDCENISPNSQTRATSNRRHPRRSISQISDFSRKWQTDKTLVEAALSGKESSSGKATSPKKIEDTSLEGLESDSIGLNDEGSEVAKELSEMLAKVKQRETLLSSPLLRSAKRRGNLSRTKVTSVRKNIEKKSSERDEDGYESRAHSESVPTDYEGEGSVDSLVTRSSQSGSIKENSLVVAQSDKNAAEVTNSDTQEGMDEAARVRLKRLEKQLGGMTPLGLRDAVAVGKTENINSRQHENRGETVLSAQISEGSNSCDIGAKSMKSKKYASASKPKNTKDKTVASNLEQEKGSSSNLENDISSKSKRKAQNRKDIQTAATQSLSLLEAQESDDKGANVRRRRRSAAWEERSDSDGQSRTVKPEVSPEQAKKLEKLQKKLGGMTPVDRTLALLSESRAKLSTTMPSLMDLNASQSKEASSKVNTKLISITKQQTKGDSRPSPSNKPASSKKRKDSSSRQESTKSVKYKMKIKLKVNKTRKVPRGNLAKVMVDSDPEEDAIKEIQTSESEMEEEDSVEEVNLNRKRKISDLCDLDVVLKHLKEEGELNRNNLRKKRLRTVQDEIISSVSTEMLELINVNTRMKDVTLLERKAHTKLTKKRKELLELQQEHRKFCGRISDLKKQKKTNATDPSTNKEVSQFLKSLEHLYKEAGRVSSDGE